ncbi:heavy metal-responsive transcriptional regulator [Nocardia salmonicida]|uniref:heavy metal-responsive transcriptional regulator n=1 Tax=Nocardia salmonicida TaxID=53431 RepID=UPI003448EB90
MKIGELAAASGLIPTTIRFYESQGLMPEPDRTPSGYRDYTDEHLTRLQFIRRAQTAGLSLREAGEILAIHDGGEQPCRHVREVLATRLDQVRAQIRELLTLESHLQDLLHTAHGVAPSAHDTAAVCWILEAVPTDDEPANHS